MKQINPEPEDQKRWQEIFRQVEELKKKDPPKYGKTPEIYNQPGLEQELDEILEETSDGKVISLNSRKKNQK